MTLQPLITICGTTGVGKSKLAIEIAQMIGRSHIPWKGARIINADSMQVYAGMDIITNKVPESERGGIEHLLMGLKKPGEQYVVGQWLEDAINVIEETHRRNQIPIVVGGTSYWIQHLMFPNRLSPTSLPGPTSFPQPSPDVYESVKSLPNHLANLFNNLPEQPPSLSTDADTIFALHSLLYSLDPTVAERWHWKDARKVLRSLQIIKDTGRKVSEHINEQAQTVLEPRYNTLCFWLYADPAILGLRLDSRVDDMVEQGLLDEVKELQNLGTPQEPIQSTDILPETENPSADYTLGIYQSIGYREFHKYLNLTDSSDKAFNEATESMKHSTRKYAKRQVSWIRNKLLPAIYAANSAGHTHTSAYLLDATELGEKWNSEVCALAEDITQKFLGLRELPDPLSLSVTARKMLEVHERPTNPAIVLEARRKIICPICTVNEHQPIMIEQGREWEAHRKTRQHRRLERHTERKPFNGRSSPKSEKSDNSDLDSSQLWEGTSSS